MNKLIWMYLWYLIYLIYTGFYVYNRIKGNSAQFVITRVMPQDSKAMKLFVDCCVAISFLMLMVAIILRTIRELVL